MAEVRLLTIPNFCHIHLHELIVERLGVEVETTDEEWQRWVTVLQQLILPLAIKCSRIRRMVATGRDLQEVLTTQGCLACWHVREYRFVTKLLNAKGLVYGEQVAAGVIEDAHYKEWR
jgi:hypothetical protein